MFKPNHSTTQCTFASNEIVQYYINNKSTVYVLMLDCSKAFDRVNYIKLFSILIEKRVMSICYRGVDKFIHKPMYEN